MSAFHRVFELFAFIFVGFLHGRTKVLRYPPSRRITDRFGAAGLSTVDLRLSTIANP